MRQTLVLAALAMLTAACGGGRSAPEAAPAPAPVPQSRSTGATQPWSPADPPPRQAAAAAAPMPSLYVRLGGVAAIRSVVDTMVARIFVDDRINAFFRGVDMDTVKVRLTEQVCVATGGPCVYRGRTMPEAHRGLALTDAHFDALVEDLVSALDAHRVPAREKGELLGALGGLRPQIVGQ